MYKWNVRVQTNPPIDLGVVYEKNEDYARCVAWLTFGISEDDDTDPERVGIRIGDDFDVTPA